MIARNWSNRAVRSQLAGYAAAVAVPIALTFVVAWLQWPPFVFEHMVVLLVVALAIPWGLRVAVVTAIVAVLADDLMLQEPAGRPTITGYRDMVDLALFAAVAVIVSGLVARARADRMAAQQAAERERRAREDRDRLIATVSHDLGTPLAVLGGTVQFLQRFGRNTEVDLPRLLQRLETATARATSLVRTLGDAQAIQTDGFALRLAPTDLRTLVGPIVQMLDHVSDRHPVLLVAPDRPVPVLADTDRLQRVIENVVNNAIKYSPNGGAVEVSIAVEDGQAVVRVRDHGIGISPAALPHVFQRAYRAPEAEAAAPGLGLGLHIAAQIVTRHGGTMDAEAAEGGGAVVSLRLPLQAVDLVSPRPSSAPSHPDIRRDSTLTVSDADDTFGPPARTH